MRRYSYLLALLVCFAAPAAADSVRDELAREILQRVPDWPQAQVEIPISVYEQFVRDALLGPTPPKPPEAAWLERAAWTLRAGESDEAVIEVTLDVAALPGRLARHVKLLPTAVVWRDVAIDGKATELRRADDGWFWLDPSAAGRYRVTAKATLKVNRRGDQRQLAWATPPAAWTTAAAESDAAWDVRFSRASAAIVGGDKGTHGAVGLVPGDRLEVTWQKPQPLVHRAAQIEYQAQVGWTLGEGVHHVQAVVNLRLWGGEVQELTLDLPQGADRVSITGPDVREVQPAGSAAHVFLRGPVVQRTRLNVSYEVPRAKTGRMAFPAFSIQGASARGGTLAIGGGSGAVLLEIESPGLAPMALHDLPDTVRGLLAAPPVYGYQAGAGAWNAQVDVVDMAEFPVRETLADSALYTVLYRPDGHIMTKVLYEVRNRGQQYMKIELPPGSQLLVARVAEQQKNMARGPGDTIFVPLEKSVLTTAGLVSFPVEVVYATKGPALARAGRLRLPLPRTDLPVAYARCAVFVPEGLQVRRWEGLLREVPTWSNETAETEFEYGHGHLAAGLKAPEPKTPLGGNTNLFAAAEQPAPEAPKTTPAAQPPLQKPAEDTRKMTEEEVRDPTAPMIQGKNYYRAGYDYYNRGDYQRAQEFFNKAVEVAPNSTEAENAKKFLGNVDIALGKQDKGKGEDRSLRATTKAVQMAQQGANVDFVSRQQGLLAQAEQSIKAGNENDAEAAYKLALSLSGKLQARGEEAKEQEAVVRKAKEFVQKREEGRKAASQEVAKLQEQVQTLRASISQRGGDVAAYDSALASTRQNQTGGIGGTPQVRANLQFTIGGAGKISAEHLDGITVDHIGTAASVTRNAPTVFSGIVQNNLGAGTYTLSGTNTVSAGGLLVGGGTLSLAETGKDRASAALTRTTAGVVVQNNGAPVAMTKFGAGTQILSGTNTYTGATDVGGGVSTFSGTTSIAAGTLRTHAVMGATVKENANTIDSFAIVPQPGAGVSSGGQLRIIDATGAGSNVPEQAGRSAQPQSSSAARAPQIQLGEAIAEQQLAARGKGNKTLTLQGGGAWGAAAGDVSDPSGRVEQLKRQIDELKSAKQNLESQPAPRSSFGAIDARDLGRQLAEKSKEIESRADHATQLARLGRIAEAQTLLADLDKDEKAVTRGARVRGTTGAGTLVMGGTVQIEGGTINARLGDDQSRLTLGTDASKPVAADYWFDGGQAGRKLEEARQTVAAKARELATVNFNVEDIAQNKGDEKKLAEYVANNYSWAFNQSRSAVQAGSGQTVTLSGTNTYTGGITLNAGTLTLNGMVVQVGTNLQVAVPQGQVFYDTDGAQVTLQAGDGTLAVTNNATISGNVNVVLERLRANLGQSVSVGSRNIFVDERSARAAGVEWKKGANGVAYALVNEGQLLGLMDIEQRASNAAKAVATQGDVRQDAVVGTPAILANGGVVNIARAADEDNTLSYNGNDIQVTHEDYLLVDNGGYLTAVKSTRMRHWTEEAAPVRFPGVPAVVTVPVVGRTVKFEKTLLDASDSLELVADYSWQGDEK